ncbi:MAG TPA: DUF1223 domain-containing protein [Steroidobacteraceae bacterium]|nr:DUF1223 domain-containing protein [Steroidobacteraceae bacterium]
MFTRSIYTVALGIAICVASAAHAQPVVVELFTSQGCSSCPPANANLAAIANRPDVLALSFGVTYWDYLGWKDTFAKPEFTARQVGYERGLGHSGPFTPQIVVNGSSDTVGNELGEVQRLVSTARLDGPQINLDGSTVSISSTASAIGADVWLVRYEPRTIEVSVARGENEGVTLPHRNVVRELTRLGTWSGKLVSFKIPPAPSGLATAILVQRPNGGAILAAYKG